MSRKSDNQVIQLAINPALLDRESFLDSVRGNLEMATETRAQIVAFKGLRGKKLADLTADEQKAAMQALVFAEQWESTLADANPGRQTELKARADVTMFQSVRHRLFGRTKLEAILDNCPSVDVQSYFS